MSDRYVSLLARLTSEFIRQNLARDSCDGYQGEVFGSSSIHDPGLFTAHEHSIVWARRHGAIDDDSEGPVRDGRYVWMCAGAISRLASPSELALLSEGMTWFFVVDDVMDDRQTAGRLELDDVRNSIRIFKILLQDPDASIDESLSFGGRFSAVCSMTRSIGASLREKTAGAEPFLRAASAWLDSVVLEYCCDAGGVELELSDYLQLRLQTVAIVPIAELVFLVNDQVGPIGDARDPVASHLYTLAAGAIAMLNDVVSLRKDLLMSGGRVPFNAVTLEFDALVDAGVGSDRAAMLAIQRSVRRYENYQAAIDLYSSWLPRTAHPSLVTGIKNFVHAVAEWHISLTERYR
jgi:hypothetical protein